MGYGISKNWLFAVKRAILAAEQKKGPKGVQNQKFGYILEIITLCGANLVHSLAACSFVFIVYLQLIDHKFVTNTSMGCNIDFCQK